MALIAKYVARHRLREPRLLDTIANFLLKRGEQLDSKVSACGVTIWVTSICRHTWAGEPWLLSIVMGHSRGPGAVP